MSIRPPLKSSNKNQFKKKLEDTSVSQEDVLNKLQVNTAKHIINSFIDKYSETLNNLENNELENTLQTTMEMLEEEYIRLVKIQQSSQRDLERLKKVLSDETKKQQLYFTQTLLSSSDNRSMNSIPEEAVSKAQRTIELKITLLNLNEHLASLKASLQPYEHIPDDMEEACAKVKELERKIRDIDEQVLSKFSNTSLNDSTEFE